MSSIINIPLNTYRESTKRLISSRQIAHATVLQSFAPAQNTSDESGRVLWRLSRTGRNASLVIVSPQSASPEHIIEECGWSGAGSDSYQQTDYKPLLESLQYGESYKFSITVNPTKAITGSKRRLIIDQGDVESWLFHKMLSHGATLTDVSVDDYNIDSFRREKSKVTLAVADVSGTLTISNLSQFKEALVSGVGRAKGYGCGLLILNEKVS